MSGRVSRCSDPQLRKLRLGRRQHLSKGGFKPVPRTVGVFGPVEQPAVDMKREARRRVPELVLSQLS